jgi:putative nucleotidyltransferase with HDIG domain
MSEASRRATLSRLEERVDQLPLLPEVVVGLLRLDPTADEYFDQVASLVRSDPAFATRLLRYANSAAAAPAQRIGTLEQALVFVGCRGVLGLIVSHSSMKVFVPRGEWERDLWRHAFDVACLMQSLAATGAGATVDPDKAYLFGLLHDIGRFILYLEAPEDLRSVDETDWASPDELIAAEQAICGFTHAELGYLAVRKWRLPDELALAIRYHHSLPDDPASLRLSDVIRLIQDADRISMALAVRRDLWRTMTDDELRLRLETSALRGAFGVDWRRSVTLVRQALARSAQMQRALGITAPATSRI